MPIFIDTHENTTELPPDLTKTVTSRVNAGQPDDFGVIDRGVLFDKQSRTAHCVLEAPDVDAVVAHHESLKVPLERGTVHRGDFILRE